MKGSVASGCHQPPLSLLIRPALSKAIGPHVAQRPGVRLAASSPEHAPRLAPLDSLRRPGQLARKMLRDSDPRLRERRENAWERFFICSNLTFVAGECVILTDLFQRPWVLVQSFGAFQGSEEASSPLTVCSGSAVGSFSNGERHACKKQASNDLETVCPQLPDSPGKPLTQNRVGGRELRSVRCLRTRKHRASSFASQRMRTAVRDGFRLR